MAERLFQLRAFFSYWLDAVDEHALHSPFFFDFYTQVVNKPYDKIGIAEFENLRKKLLNDPRAIATVDLGSGTAKSDRTIARIARKSLTPLRFSQLYHQTIVRFHAKVIVELGTSLGVNTLYLAQQKDSHVTTFEGSPEIADIAQSTFDFAHCNNVTLVRGNIDHTLPVFLSSIRKIDFVLIDANHRYQPTVRYFEMLLPKLHHQSVVVIDDIAYTKAMRHAWRQLKSHELVYASADLFRCGILFFDPSLNKQHVILQA